MSKYFLRRLLILVPALLGISLILFTVLALAPGDPFEELATNPMFPRKSVPTFRAHSGWTTDRRSLRALGCAMVKGDWGFPL